MAINNQGIYSALVGDSDGSVYRAVTGSSGKSYERLITVDPQVPVTALSFATDNVALVGYSTGVVISISNPFASNWTSAFRPRRPSATRWWRLPTGTATSELYAATNKNIFRSINRGVSWGNVTGAGTRWPTIRPRG